jgi:hypothetical protein
LADFADKSDEARQVLALIEDGDNGQIKCPLCEHGQIDWWRLDPKSRLRAMCSTEGCFIALS